MDPWRLLLLLAVPKSKESRGSQYTKSRARTVLMEEKRAKENESEVGALQPDVTKKEVDDTNNNMSHNNHKKRKREGSDKRPDHLTKAYKNVQFEPRISEPSDIEIPGVDHVVTTTRPGSPSRLFSHSYTATFKNTQGSTHVKQAIHQHVNGLCIVTAGDSIKETIKSNIEKIEFMVSTSDPCSAGERRKRQSKMLKKGIKDKNSGLVTPDTVLAKVHLQDGSSIPIYAFCWGSIMELNTKVTPKQIQEDPLIQGYLAVLLPTGPFPPRECVICEHGRSNNGESNTAEDDDNDDIQG
mgnify:CR=1 FL=1